MHAMSRETESYTQIVNPDLAHEMAGLMDVSEHAAVNADRHNLQHEAAILRDIAHFKGEAVRVNYGRKIKGRVSYHLPPADKYLDSTVTRIEEARDLGTYEQKAIVSADAGNPDIQDQITKIAAITGASEWVEAKPKWPEYVGRDDIITMEAQTEMGVILQRVQRPVKDNRSGKTWDLVEVFAINPDQRLTRKQRDRLVDRYRHVNVVSNYRVPFYERAVNEIYGAILAFLPARREKIPPTYYERTYYIARDGHKHSTSEYATPTYLDGDANALLAVAFRVAEFTAMLEGSMEVPDDLRDFIEEARESKAYWEEKERADQEKRRRRDRDQA